MTHESRITAGGIEILIDPSQVERKGFASLFLDPLSLKRGVHCMVRVHSTEGEFVLKRPYDEISVRNRHPLDICAQVLRQTGHYLAHATWAKGDGNLTGDLYKKKD